MYKARPTRWPRRRAWRVPLAQPPGRALCPPTRPLVGPRPPAAAAAAAAAADPRLALGPRRGLARAHGAAGRDWRAPPPPGWLAAAAAQPSLAPPHKSPARGRRPAHSPRSCPRRLGLGGPLPLPALGA
eukprot:scaffold1141_cov369-Prasinococcus_capsulatus_cf.AAC.14